MTLLLLILSLEVNVLYLFDFELWYERKTILQHRTNQFIAKNICQVSNILNFAEVNKTVPKIDQGNNAPFWPNVRCGKDLFYCTTPILFIPCQKLLFICLTLFTINCSAIFLCAKKRIKKNNCPKLSTTSLTLIMFIYSFVASKNTLMYFRPCYEHKKHFSGEKRHTLSKCEKLWRHKLVT